MRTGRVALAPEGFGLLIASALLVVVAVVLSLAIGGGRGLWFPAGAALWFLLMVEFFRDPARTPPAGESLILAPADGRVISVGEALDSPLSPPGTRVSIFMSLLDVHVNRAPVAGTVTSVTHRPGRFKPAFKPAASRENEQLLVSIETPYGEVALKQIAGFFARRTVFHPRSGDRLQPGDRVGMIHLGSRVDLFLPDLARIRVYRGDRVTAGETIIGEFTDA